MLFIAAVAGFNSGVAILRIQPVQSLDAPELALYLPRQCGWCSPAS
ncbi:MAG: hypothetical protein ACLP2Y_05690 [Limisphaerales bacterium]